MKQPWMLRLVNEGEEAGVIMHVKKTCSSLWCNKLGDSGEEYAKRSNTLRLAILVVERLLKQGTVTGSG